MAGEEGPYVLWILSEAPWRAEGKTQWDLFPILKSWFCFSIHLDSGSCSYTLFRELCPALMSRPFV